MHKKITFMWLLAASILGWVGCQKKEAARTLTILGERQVDSRTNDTAFYKVKGFNLVSQQGKTTDDGSFANQKISVVSFFFSRCPSICPVLTKNLSAVHQTFKNDPMVSLHSVSIDPEHDSPAILAAYATQNGIAEGNWTFYTGEKAAVFELAKNCKLKAFDQDIGHEGLIHEPTLVLLDSQKRIRGYYNGLQTTDIHQLIKDIQILKNETLN
jgi:protein SCO1